MRSKTPTARVRAAGVEAKTACGQRGKASTPNGPENQLHVSLTWTIDDNLLVVEVRRG